MKYLSIICPTVAALTWMFLTNRDDKNQNKRLDALEQKYETSGVTVNGWQYQVEPYLFPTNAVEYYKNK